MGTQTKKFPIAFLKKHLPPVDGILYAHTHTSWRALTITDLHKEPTYLNFMKYTTFLRTRHIYALRQVHSEHGRWSKSANLQKRVHKYFRSTPAAVNYTRPDWGTKRRSHHCRVLSPMVLQHAPGAKRGYFPRLIFLLNCWSELFSKNNCALFVYVGNYVGTAIIAFETLLSHNTTLHFLQLKWHACTKEFYSALIKCISSSIFNTHH